MPRLLVLLVLSDLQPPAVRFLPALQRVLAVQSRLLVPVALWPCGAAGPWCAWCTCDTLRSCRPLWASSPSDSRRPRLTLWPGCTSQTVQPLRFSADISVGDGDLIGRSTVPTRRGPQSGYLGKRPVDLASNIGAKFFD